MIRVDGPRHVWVPQVIELMRAQGRAQAEIEQFRREIMRHTFRGARCGCPRDGLPPLNPCPRHEPGRYAQVGARHRARAAVAS